MTYSIVARCPRTGQLGLGTATYSIATGGRCEGVLAGVGVSRTQAYVNRGNDVLAIQLLEQGYVPTGVMRALEANDRDHDYRQIAIVDREGRTAAFTGSGTRPWSGHLVGNGHVGFGNVPAALKISRVVPTIKDVIVEADLVRSPVHCPTCGLPSLRLHSNYLRVLRDLPWQGRPATIRVTARRFRRLNPACARKTFAEKLGSIAPVSARRSCSATQYNWPAARLPPPSAKAT